MMSDVPNNQDLRVKWPGAIITIIITAMLMVPYTIHPHLLWLDNLCNCPGGGFYRCSCDVEKSRYLCKEENKNTYKPTSQSEPCKHFGECGRDLGLST